METAQNPPALLFDLDGTLVDSVSQHVRAGGEALESCGIELAVGRIHRRIGMSGGIFANAMLRETGKPVTAEMADQLQRRHAEAYAQQVAKVRPLPGAQQLLALLSKAPVPWAIATSGGTEFAQRTLGVLQIDPAI